MRKAFTLIELMVVVAIISIILAISAQALMSTRKEREVKNLAEQTKIRLVAARQFAVIPPSEVHDLQKVKITVDNSAHAIIISKIKNSGSSDGEISRINFGNQITLSLTNPESGSTNSFSFTANNPHYFGQIQNVGGNVIVSISNDVATYKVEIDQVSGSIKVNK